jgi:diaminopropionate ammonia-lyase
VKDESHRFGIKAFKALGASYAIYNVLKKFWEQKFGTSFGLGSFSDISLLDKLGSFTFSAATDGNHGKAVAWTARILNQKAVIYMPDNTAAYRIENIEKEGANVKLVKGTFDDCVKQNARDAEINNWQVISDTAYEGYMEIPNYIMAGYSTIFRELESQEINEFDFVFLQAGVGGLAAAGAWYFTRKFKEKRPKLICVEPTESDCFLESIINGNGKPIATKGKQESIMAGLNCGIPSELAWPYIKDNVDLFIAITDNYAEKAMKQYYHPIDNDERIISGESGASGLAGMIALFNDKNLAYAKEVLGFNNSSKILIINSEGDTDPVFFKKTIES